MKSMPALFAIACLLGCGGVSEDPVDDAKNGVNAGVEMSKEAIGDEVSDRLDCSGLVREETRTLVTDTLADVELDGEVVVAPTELARLIGAVTASTDSTALLIGNVAAISQLGHFPQAHAGEWDELACDDNSTEACTDAALGAERGSVTSTVVCDGEEASVVRLGFEDQCRLFVTENSGAVTLRRDDGAYLFEEFALGSVRQVDGAMTASFETAETDRFTVAEDEGLSIASNAGKSCEERLTVRRLEAERSPTATTIDLNAERLSDGKTFTVRTPEGPAAFTGDAACSCPDPGSVLDVRWQGFLKGEGDANLRLNYREPTGEAASCAGVDVEILSWPEQCNGESTDCGRANVEKLLGPLFSVACRTR